MPIYEYACGHCGAEFEELVRTAAEEKQVACPRCGQRKATRRPSVFAARSAAAKPALPMGGGACGRCGDPNGPCGMD